MTLIGTVTQFDRFGEPTVFTFPDGTQYKGDFLNRFPDGYGSLYNKDSTLIEEKVGYWRRGSFVCAQNELERNPAKYRFLIEE